MLSSKSKEDVGSSDLHSVLFQELPFIDRKEELCALDLHLQPTREGEGRILFLTGEAGIGKTRLAQEIAKRAEEAGFRCLFAKCSKSDAGSPLYLPWTEFIRQFLHQATADIFFKVCDVNFPHVVRLVPELLGSVKHGLLKGHSSLSPTNDDVFAISSSNPRKTPEDIQREESEFHLALTQVFTRLSENSPLLLVLDDMQWCDAASLKMVNFLVANNLAKTRILLLCLYRDIDLEEGTDPVFAQFIADLRQQGQFGSIHLSRFGQKNVDELVDKVFLRRTDECDRDLPDLLYSRTGGNPLFIGETLKSLLERRIIFTNERGDWTCSGFRDRFLVPDSIKRVIEQRLERLDDEVLDTLQIASVIGERFSFDILLKVVSALPSEVTTLRSSLEKASKSGLILEKEFWPGNPGYAFSDESVKDVLYDMVSSAHRQHYHLTVAKSLEEMYVARGENLSKDHYSEFAYHFLRGANNEKAQEFFIKAGRRASELYAHSQSYAYYDAALELLESEGKDGKELLLRADLLKNMGDESQFLPEYQRSSECWKRAAELYEKCGERLKAAEVLVKLGMAYHIVMYELDKAEESLDKAFQLAKENSSTPSAELARIAAYSMTADIWRSDRGKVREKSALALRLAKESGAYDVVSLVSSYAIGTDLAGEIKESIESCNRGLKIANEHGLMFEASYNYFHRAVSCNYTYGPSRESLKLFLEGLNFTASRSNFMVNLFHKVELLYGVYLPLGEWKKAREMAEESIKSVQGFPPSSLFRLIAESAMGHVLLSEGDLDEAEWHLIRVRDATKGFGVLQLDVPLYVALARLYIEKGDLGKAEAHIQQGYRLSKQRGLTVINGIPHIQLLSLMIEFALLKGSESSRFLDSTLAELSESGKEIGQEWTLAYLHRAEGLVASERKQNEHAASLLQRSIESFGKLGWPYELARTQYKLGLVCLRSGNVLGSTRLFDSAYQTFSKLGANLDLEKITSVRKKIAEQGTPILGKHPKFENKGAELVFESLITEFMQDFLFKKLDVERCGWRSLSELLRNLNLKKYALYGRGYGTRGPILNELLSASLVETRMFAGERGRGGEIMKIRIVRDRTLKK